MLNKILSIILLAGILVAVPLGTAAQAAGCTQQSGSNLATGVGTMWEDTANHDGAWYYYTDHFSKVNNGCNNIEVLDIGYPGTAPLTATLTEIEPVYGWGPGWYTSIPEFDTHWLYAAEWPEGYPGYILILSTRRIEFGQWKTY